MYCPACGKQIPDSSTFCLHCGTRIEAPVPLDRSQIERTKPVEWEYTDFGYEFLPPGQGMWAKLGPGGYSEAGAKLEFWQNSQREITAELQKWIDEGWEPIGEVGSSCIEIKTSYSHRDKSPLYWVLFLLFSIPTFGVLFLFALILGRSNLAEPIRFVLQLRAPLGTRVPISPRASIQSERIGSGPNEEERNKEKARAEAGKRRLEQERLQKQRAEEERRKKQEQRKRARATLQSVLQTLSKNAAAVSKSTVISLITGVFASLVVSTIWVVTFFILFEQSEGLLIKSRSVVSAIVELVLFLGGLFLIFLVGILPVYTTVRGLRGIVVGLVVGFLGLVGGIVVGEIIMTILFSIVFP